MSKKILIIVLGIGFISFVGLVSNLAFSVKNAELDRQKTNIEDCKRDAKSLGPDGCNEWLGVKTGNHK